MRDSTEKHIRGGGGEVLRNPPPNKFSELSFQTKISTVSSHSVFNNHHVAEWKSEHNEKFLLQWFNQVPWSVARSHSSNFILEILLSDTHNFVTYYLQLQICTDK